MFTEVMHGTGLPEYGNFAGRPYLRRNCAGGAGLTPEAIPA